jgi:hypothetical protein
MTHKSKNLSATARALLTVAASRDENLVPLPRLPVAAARQVIRSLLRLQLVEEVPAPIEDATYAWRSGEDGGVLMLRVTKLGLARVRDGETDTRRPSRSRSRPGEPPESIQAPLRPLSSRLGPSQRRPQRPCWCHDTAASAGCPGLPRRLGGSRCQRQRRHAERPGHRSPCCLGRKGFEIHLSRNVASLEGHQAGAGSDHVESPRRRQRTADRRGDGLGATHCPRHPRRPRREGHQG